MTALTNRDRVLEYLRSISPQDATNAEIVAHTGIKPHPQVFQITQQLYKSGLIKGSKGDGEWQFWYGPNPTIQIYGPAPAPIAKSPAAFEEQI